MPTSLKVKKLKANAIMLLLLFFILSSTASADIILEISDYSQLRPESLPTTQPCEITKNIQQIPSYQITPNYDQPQNNKASETETHELITYIGERAPVFPKDHPMNDYSDVLLIVNDNSIVSKQIGDYFRSQRNIPDINICNITVAESEAIDRAEFNSLRSQVESYLGDNGLTDKINYIITTKGVPLRITHGTANRRASVDSELCLILSLWNSYIDDPTNTRVQHIYYLKDEEFSREQFNLYLVTRLTGYNFSDVKQLIDNAALSANQRDSGGTFFFDADLTKQGTSWARPGNTRMNTAHNLLDGRFYSSSLDWSNTFNSTRNNLAGYCSWGGFDSNYYSTPVQNRGLDLPDNDAVPVPTGWFYDATHISTNISRNTTMSRSTRFSVNITNDVNDAGYAALSQNVTIKPNFRYFLTGYVNLDNVANYAGGGAFLQIKAYNSTNDMVWERNGTRRIGDNGNSWWALDRVPYAPIPGVTKLRISAVLSKSKGRVFFDDLALYVIRPKNTYVPGAIAEVYGYRTAWTFDYDNTYYRFLYGLNIGELIMDGITGVKGYVDYGEGQYIQTCARVDTLFERYTEGYNLAESYYMASPYMSWLDVVIGDPKTNPYFSVLPDAALEVENLTFSKDYLNQGESVTINATIENRGGKDLNNLNVTIMVGLDLDNTTSIYSEAIANIPPQETKLFSYEWDTINYNGTQTIWIYADYLDIFREQNETNNYKSKQLVINSYPFGINLEFSAEEFYRGESVEIYVNASDLETPRNELDISIFFNHSSINAWTLLPNVSYQTDHWQTTFVTDSLSTLGFYDIAVNISDQNNATSELVIINAFKVLNNPPVLGTLEISDSIIYRTQNLTINFTAYDFEETIDVLDVYLRVSGEELLIRTDAPVYIEPPDKWQVLFEANKTTPTGMYDVLVFAKDIDLGEASLTLSEAIEILNNAPIIERVVLSKSEIFRRDYTTISILGSDVETPINKIIVELEFRLAFDIIQWTAMAPPQPKDTYWEIVFYTNISSLVGNYTFRSRLQDGDGVWTDYITSETELRVLNNPPVAVHNFGIDGGQANEDDLILFDAANSTDIEDNTCSGFHWEFGDGINSGQEKVFHAYSNKGVYDVTLTVYDKNLGYNFTTTQIEIINLKPSVQIIVDRIQAFVGEPIMFDGTGSSDSKSDLKNLTYLWDFNDGNTSNQSKVEYAYSRPGTYIITLTVIDNDGANQSSLLYITIEPLQVEPDDDKDEKSELNTYIFYIILLIIILVVLGIVSFALKKRKLAAERSKLVDEKPELKPIETVEADIIAAPEFGGEGVGAATGTGKTVKPKTAADKTEALPPVTSTLDEQLTLEPEPAPGMEPFGEDIILPEVEVEFAPEHTLPEEGPEVTAEIPSEGPEELPEILGEIELPVPTDRLEELEEGEIDFVPPKIDIPILPEQQVQPLPRPEIEEAHKRGEGVSLEFKRPKKKER